MFSKWLDPLVARVSAVSVLSAIPTLPSKASTLILGTHDGKSSYVFDD